MPGLELFLLGSPRIDRDGVPIQLDTRKAIALLAYLAVTGESHRRDTLATLLWSDSDQIRARAALRRTLSALNKALAWEGLKVDRETVGLDMAADLSIDLAQFRSRLGECLAHPHASADVCDTCPTLLTEAAGLYRGDFMAGFTLRDSPTFDDWQFSQTDTLRRELAGALERLVRFRIPQGEMESAIRYARRWLSLDTLDESAHRQLMQLYSRADQRAAALRQYRECVRVLDQELGVPPLEETTQLYQAIRENQAPPTLARSHAPSALPAGREKPTRLSSFASSATLLSSYPLVVRSAEWDTLLRAYAAIGADGHLIVLEGEAGIGKTRLAQEFLADVREKGAATVAARCYEGEASLAFGPFVEALRAAIGQADHADDKLEGIPEHGLSELARLLPDLGSLRPGLPPAPPLNSPGAQSRFFESISQVLLAMCRGPVPGVLFLDDLHWADEASIELLTYLTRRLQRRPICILITWRIEQMSAEHRLRLLLAESQRADTATLVPLSRLSLPAITELVQAISATGVILPQAVEKRLYRDTEGLPFFLVEYLATLTGSPDTGGDHWALPSSVRHLLHSRLAAVSGTARQLLDAGAVIGRSFDFGTLQKASGRGDEETIVALEALIAQGLVNETKGSDVTGDLTYDFSHEQLRALVYEEISLARCRLLHRRVAEAQVSRSRGRRDSGSFASLIAQHYRLAGQDSEAADYFRLAGDHARALFANVEASSHYRSALVLGHSDAGALHEAIGDLQTLIGEYDAAITSYETAAALGQPISLASVERKLGNVHLRRGDWEMADSYFQAALSSLGETGPAGQRSELYADWSLATHRRGRTPQALELARQAVELAEAVGDANALAQAHNILGILARSRGELEEACHHLEISLSLAETLGDPSAKVAALNNLALAQGAIGEFEQAIALIETALTLCASQGDRHREAALHNNIADLLHSSGRSESAMEYLKKGLAIFAEIGADPDTMQPEIWKLVEW